MSNQRARLRWLVGILTVLALLGVAAFATARARARARWVAVLDHWEVRSEEFYRECFPEVAASEVSGLVQRRVHPGKEWPEGFGSERVRATLFGGVKETMLPLWVRHGTGWSLGHLLVRQERRGLTADLTVRADLHGPEDARAAVMRSLRRLFESVDVEVVQ